MKCPYCQKEMQLGKISNWLQPIQWIPDGQKPSLFSFSVAQNGISLINQSKLLKVYGYKAEAYYSSKCRIIIAPTKE